VSWRGMDPGLDPALVIAEFLQTYLEDVEGDCVRTSAEYEARFPGFEEVVRREFQLLVGRAVDRDGAVGATSRLGPYDLGAPLGAGGQAQVLRATDVRVGRAVALKILHHLDPTALRRIRREAEILGSLDHPGICTLLDAGHEGGKAYLAMRLVEGRTLASHLAEARRGDGLLRLPGACPGPAGAAQAAARLLAGVARAVHVAHQAGVIHRDLKPGNIMVTEDRGPVVLDFGLARLQDSPEATATSAGAIVGTAAYMAPEVLAGSTPERSADIWALGVTLYEALTGRRPFEAPTRDALFRRISDAPVPDPRPASPAIGRDHCAILECALAKEPSCRYATAEHLALDLEAVAEGRPVSVRRASLAARALSYARRHPAAAALALLLALGLPLLAGGVGFLIAGLPDREMGRRVREEEAAEARLAVGFARLEESRGAKEAARIFAELQELPDLRREALAGRAIALLDLQHPGAAAAFLAPLPESTQSPGLARALAYLLSLEGAPTPPEVTACAESPLEDSVDLLIAAEVEIMRGHRGEKAAYARASALAAEAILRAPRKRAVYLGSLAHALGHDPDADPAVVRATARSLISSWPDSGAAAFWAAFALMTVSAVEAAAIGRRAVELDPGNAQAAGNLGYIEMQRGRNVEALAFLQRSAELAPAVVGSHLNLCVVLRRLQRHAEAVQAARAGLSLDPEHPGLLINLAMALQSAGEEEAAVHAYREVLARNPEDRQAANNLAWILVNRGERGGEARALLRQALAPPMGVPQAANTLAGMLAAEADWEQAVEVLEAGLVAFRDRSRGAVKPPPSLRVALLHGLASALSRGGRADEALDRAHEALQADPGHGSTHLLVAGIELGRGRLAPAMSAARAALEARESSAEVVAAARALLLQSESALGLEAELMGVRSGAEPAGDREQLLAMAQLAEKREWSLTAARLYEATLAGVPGGRDPHLIPAARAAVRAGRGLGEDACELDFEERVRWRAMGLAWLRDLLAVARSRSGGQAGVQLAEALEEPPFAALTGPGSAALVPAAEARAWAELRALARAVAEEAR
jgi:tetratricopeptide (TPR) repeat protein